MGHWYLPDGTPFYQVPNKTKGGMRDAHLGDARKVSAYPSVTAVLGVLDKPNLTNWKLNQAIIAARTNPHIRPDMSLEELVKLVKADAAEQANQAAARGTDIHDCIEQFYKTQRIQPEYKDTIIAAVECVREHCGEQKWQAEVWFASPLGYGGKIDLISDEWLIDFKTKEGPAEKHEMYDEQAMQLAAYDQGRGRKLANVIVSRDDGSVKFWHWDNEEDNARQLQKFLALLTYWQLDKDYFPHREQSDE